MKPVLQFTKDGVFVKEYESIKAAELAMNCVGGIGDNLKGRNKSSCGYIWKYK